MVRGHDYPPNWAVLPGAAVTAELTTPDWSRKPVIEILGNPALNIPSGKRSKKTLTQLKALAETMNQLEKDTDFLLYQVLNGGNNE